MSAQGRDQKIQNSNQGQGINLRFFSCIFLIQLWNEQSNQIREGNQ